MRPMDASGYFRGKNVTLMRIGLLGRGVGDARYLAAHGATVLVVDDAPQSVMQPSVDALKDVPNIRFKFGAYDLDDFRRCDLVLKGAGTPLDSSEIAEAHKHGIPVRMSADLFAELSGATCIGVTGTRGKSTVAHMLHAILTAAGKPVLLGGNVRGVSTLAFLDEATPEHIAVLELDSWQLQGFGEARISPHIAVFTTLYDDHLNYYKNDRAAYLADKANIFKFQTPNDTLIVGEQAVPAIEAQYPDALSRAVVADAATVPSDWRLAIPGEHNRYDAGLALSAARALGSADETSRRALEAFRGVPGRLELVGEKGGVKIYNDTTETTPEATLAALAALGPKRTVLIMGGADKNLDMTALVAKIPEVKKTVLLSGTGTDRIKDQVSDSMIYHTLSEAVAAALGAAENGDAVLFSPAFTSFGMFKNEYDRGDQFNALVRALV